MTDNQFTAIQIRKLQKNIIARFLENHFFWQSRLKFEPLVSVRMIEAQFGGVQAETGKFAPAVFVVADNRMTDMSAVQPELVGSARHRFEFEQRRVVISANNAKI